ncbi:MAG: hypothetical protein CMA72_07830 [Euryarchaeota archaeon]|jgi:hypothetical protein|nr:hypothetical protein [Euryarchaeota archaeon]|tara:strand:+ start:16508 stop:17002 length:495 start_codon:yes stop_codon:yes gene_type:complete
MKRLIIFDLNGIFLVRRRDATSQKPDFVVGNFKCFVRPGIRKFLKWVHHNYDVAVWSSTMPHNTIPIVRHIWGKKMKDLKFIYSQRQCTKVGTMDSGKPIFLKELKYVWEMFPWYNETNTLLIDDSPHKVVNNPPNTSIHPEPLTFETLKNPVDLRELIANNRT